MKHVLAVLAMASFLLAVHCSAFGRACTLVGCVSGFTATSPLAAKTSELSQLTITVCKNGVCASGVPTVTPEPCGQSARGCPVRVAVQLHGDLDARVGLDSVGQADSTGPTQEFPSYRLSVGLEAFGTAQRDALKNGDTYTIRVAPTNGTVALVDLKKTVTYTKSYPNGEDCDGEDGYCLFASVN